MGKALFLYIYFFFALEFTHVRSKSCEINHDTYWILQSRQNILPIANHVMHLYEIMLYTYNKTAHFLTQVAGEMKLCASIRYYFTFR